MKYFSDKRKETKSGMKELIKVIYNTEVIIFIRQPSRQILLFL